MILSILRFVAIIGLGAYFLGAGFICFNIIFRETDDAMDFIIKVGKFMGMEE